MSKSTGSAQSLFRREASEPGVASPVLNDSEEGAADGGQVNEGEK
jgi:hypothetical protein